MSKHCPTGRQHRGKPCQAQRETLQQLVGQLSLHASAGQTHPSNAQKLAFCLAAGQSLDMIHHADRNTISVCLRIQVSRPQPACATSRNSAADAPPRSPAYLKQLKQQFLIMNQRFFGVAIASVGFGLRQRLRLLRFFGLRLLRVF